MRPARPSPATLTTRLASLAIAAVAVGLVGCQVGFGPHDEVSTNSPAGSPRRDDATLASDRSESGDINHRLDRGIPEGASSNPQNDAGFSRPSGGSSTYGPTPVP